ncbi:MAG: lipase family protein [Cyanobacteria bacterium P01_D01_bin.156]
MSDSIDYKTALRCVYLSNEAYRPFDDELRFTVFPNIKPKLIDQKSTDTQVALLEDVANQRGYIVFRGSSADRDWLTNLEFSKWSVAIQEAVLHERNLDYPKEYGKSSTGVKLHKGFTKAYLAVRAEIQAAVKASAIPHWVITGHSLGGALAKLCAVDLQYNVGTNASFQAYTFGAPRVGNSAFVKSYNLRVPQTWRFVNGNDIVCGLPRRWQGYSHVEHRLRFNVPFSWRIISGSLQDHRIDRYIAAVRQRVES